MNEQKNILEQHGLKPNKILGQNFLTDKNILEKIIIAAEISKKDSVIEIGPGLGILTQKIGERAGEVIAIEKDKELAKILKDKFSEQKNIRIIEGDILEKLDSLPRADKVIANIPYYLTSRLIRLMLELPEPPKEIILMIQKEVAERICAKPPKMSLLSAAVQFYAEPKILFRVSKSAFWPRPKIDSAIIKIIPKPEQPKNDTAEFFFKILHAGFSAPRKQLLNNLSTGLNYDRVELEKILKRLGLDPKRRAETLELEDWLTLTKELFI